MNSPSAVIDQFCESMERGERPYPRAWLDKSDVVEPDRRELLLALVGEWLRFVRAEGGRQIGASELRAAYPELSESELTELSVEPDPNIRFLLEQGFESPQFLAKGEFGWVYRARYAPLGRVEAVKVFVDSPNVDDILKEAQSAAAAVKHPHVCQIYSVSDQTHPRYIRMEYVEGESLLDWSKSLAGSAKRRRRQLAGALAKVCSGIKAYHDPGVVHRDLKPDNILVARNGEPVLLDFGLAKKVSGGSMVSATKETANADELAGSPAFMAPEQIPISLIPLQPEEGGVRDAVSRQTDIYGVGAILHYLVLGRPAFAGPWPEIATEIVRRSRWQNAISEKADLEHDLRRIIEMAMRKQPVDRYRSVEHLGFDLARFAAGKPPGYAVPLRSIDRIWDGCRNYWRAAALASAALVALIVIPAVVVLGLREWRTAILVAAVENTLSQPAPHSEESQRAIESSLGELESLRPVNTALLREKYLDLLLSEGAASKPGSISLETLDRLQRNLAELENLDEQRARAWWTEDRRKEFRRQAAPYSEGTSVYFLARPDAKRLIKMRRVVEIVQRYQLQSELTPSLVELLKVHWASGNLELAAAIARDVLDLESLSSDWRLTVLRDYVWLSIEMNQEERQFDHKRRSQQIADARERVTKAIRKGEHFRPLGVSLAHLHAAAGDYASAQQELQRYFEFVAGASHSMGFHARKASSDTGGQPAENVAALFNLDAYLLHGVLLEQQGEIAQAQRVWEEGFSRVQGTPVVAYYEAAILGSLSGKLGTKDVEAMVTYSASAAGDAKGLGFLSGLINMSAVPAKFRLILLPAWRSQRGKEYARRIALRGLPFREFVRTQAGLWLFEILRLAMSPNAPMKSDLPGDPQELPAEIERLIWALVEDSQMAHKEGRLKEDQLQMLILLGLPKSTLPIASLPGFDFLSAGKLPLEGGFSRWDEYSTGLPSEVRGPAAYVLAKQYIRFGKLDDARRFFEAAKEESKRMRPGSELRSLVDRDLAELEKVAKPTK